MQNSLCADTLPLKIQGEELLLLSEKAIYWKKQKSLLIADLHIGKVTHFRNNNIPIPQVAADENFDKLEKLLIQYKPQTVLFLGDLFHSFYNKEWDKLIFALAKFPKIRFELITGNHDILKEEHYKSAGITCIREKIIEKFILTHHPEEHEGFYNLCGHIHPGVRMRGSARQYMKLPCFYFGAQQGILPAFGSFTGTAALKIQNDDQVFAVFNDQILQLNT
jgi:DNA ligase-associated metallophosphoesterase